MPKHKQVLTFLVHKNQLPFFFLCAKYMYGPQVNTKSREYNDKRVQQSFLFKT